MARMHSTHKQAARFAAAAAFLAAALLPLVAGAQTAPTVDSFQATDNDLTTHVLRSIFGDWKSGSMVPMLGEAMRVLNIFALTFGTAMFTYVAVIGTLNTAQDGELLGKKWSSMWVPLRFVFGTAMLVPLASGYSTVQHIILWLAMAGGGGASMVWSAAMHSFTEPDKAVLAVQGTEEYRNRVKTMMRKVLQAQACSAHMGERYQGVASFGLTITPHGDPNSTTPPLGVWRTSHGYTFEWGDLTGDAVKPRDVCGSLTTTDFAVQASREVDLTSAYTQAAPQGALPSSTSSSTGTATWAAYKSMVNAQAKGVKAAADSMVPAALILAQVPGYSLNVPANATADQRDAARAQLVAATLATATSIYLAETAPATALLGTVSLKKMTDYLSATQDSGWMLASSSFFQMSKIRSSATGAIGSLPEFTSPETSEASQTFGVAEAPLYEDIHAVSAKIAAAGNEGGECFTLKGLITGKSEIGECIARKIGEEMSFDPDESSHALVQLKDTGDSLLTFAGATATAVSTIYITSQAATESWIGKGVNAVTGAGGAISATFDVLGPLLYMGFLGLFGIGITMAFLLPMLPFMLSIGSILGWLMALFSAVVAAPVWLAGHLHPEGDGIAGRAVGGYMILLETVTRPIFIVFGLLGAFVIMDPVLRFVAWAFQANMRAVQAESATGIISIGVLASIYVAVVWTVVRQSLQLIHSLSEKVYNWVGGQNAGYDQARDFGAAAQQNAARAAGGGAEAVKTATGFASQRAIGKKAKGNAGGNPDGTPPTSKGRQT